jgi:hypothetical protein
VENKKTKDLFSTKCSHGRHEVYLGSKGLFCKACGLSEIREIEQKEDLQEKVEKLEQELESIKKKAAECWRNICFRNTWAFDSTSNHISAIFDYVDETSIFFGGKTNG